MMGIDLNTIEGEEEEESEEEESEAEETPAVCLELWHACAGPLISLPKKGSVVVYLPQGHLEHLGVSAADQGFRCNVPPHVFCRVVDVKLHADVAFARLSLVAQGEEIEQQVGVGEFEGDGEPEEINGESRTSLMPHMFCKTLTASDTSTHGGFSVPRRAAEDCFPPLDYKQQRPSQELVAKDLHGTEWRFRHIYRGQPRRHLLTTGWSAFVNKKKLISGDAVLFLRGNNGELRLGVRRAAQLKSAIPYSVLCSQNMNLGKLAAVADSISLKRVFHIYYNPRASPSEFIIPYWKFTKSLNYSFSSGTRFKMRFESEDAAERRYTGWVSGIGDIDPVRWPGSKWRCLLVRWDDDVDTSRQNRLSPWEIEPTGSVSGSASLAASGSKRSRICPSSSNPDYSVPNGSGCIDLGESARFHKVLQGQEIFGFRAPYGGIVVPSSQIPEIRNHQYPETRRCTTDVNYNNLSGSGSGARVPIGNSGFSYNRLGFGESVRFHKVLQGQEKFSVNPPGHGGLIDSCVKNCGFGFFDGRGNGQIQGYSILVPPSTPSVQVSSPSSVLMFQQTSQLPCPQPVYGSHTQDKGGDDNYLGVSYFSKFRSAKDASSHCYTRNMGNELNKKQHEPEKSYAKSEHAIGRNGCKLFGFPLTEMIPVVDIVDDTLSASPNATEMNYETSSPRLNPHMLDNSVGRSCTKVHKQGSVVVRAIDLSKFDGYNGLICELERLFDMEGLLNDKQKKWHVVYTDDDNDMMLVGDDPWQDFCNTASRILIYTQDEKELMACS
ncbi:auxin response factor 15-like isoform X2 [Asparagus officinalis]|uniref:auxin response factor 15-like isoform X2 n=1 Tax=Asparagus officinalis TaxID=4686 RepID=UPI00098DE955|nr:auxin response factor 15-like isoform X2 [Asparagus officinalis]